VYTYTPAPKAVPAPLSCLPTAVGMVPTLTRKSTDASQCFTPPSNVQYHHTNTVYVLYICVDISPVGCASVFHQILHAARAS
jgi:hypothetical protein